MPECRNILCTKYPVQSQQALKILAKFYVYLQEMYYLLLIDPEKNFLFSQLRDFFLGLPEM